MKVDLEKLKREVDAPKIIAGYVQLSKAGAEFKGLCPFHADSNPSFTVFKKGGTWGYKCFACDAGGDIITFLEKIENISTSAAIEKLKAFAGKKPWHEEAERAEAVFTSLSDELDKRSEVEKPKRKLSAATWARAEALLAKTPEAIAWLEKKRGISLATAQAARIGFCQATTGHVEDEANRNAGWIMFPRMYPCDAGEEVLTVKMRCIAAKDFSQISGMRQDTLFNVQSISPFDPIYVTEGEMDTLALEQAGFRAVSLPMAKAKISPDMKKALKEASAIYLAGDNDGGVGTEYMRQLRKDFKDNTYLILWPDFKDANDMFLKGCGGDIGKFRATVTRLSANAKNNPLEGVYGVVGAMENAEGGSQMDHPHRLHWRQKSIDRMAIVPPTGVCMVYSSYSKSGKSTFVMDPCIHEARRGESVLIYSAELTVDENIRIIASHVLQKDRDALTSADFKRCAEMLRESGTEERPFQFYIGYNPELRGHNEVLDFIEIAVRTFGITRVVLDHVHHIIQPDERGGMYANEVGCAKRIKDIAVKHDLVFIAVGQSNKENESVKNLKKDEHGVLNGAACWTNVAHAIYLLHRKKVAIDDPTNPPDDLLAPETDIILKAVRTKGPGKPFSRLMFKGSCSTFNDVTSFANEPEPRQQTVTNEDNY